MTPRPDRPEPTGETPEFTKGCECDSCCRLYELQVEFGLDVGNAYETADEIAGGIGTIRELMSEQIDDLSARLRASEQANQKLIRALKTALDYLDMDLEERGPDVVGLVSTVADVSMALHEAARAALDAVREEK